MNSPIQLELLRNYGLRENPFNVTPDPRFLFESRTHREALASLITGIDCGTGFQALIAPPGMGKTTLLFNVLERFHDTARTAFLFQTQCNSREFLQYLLSELGVESADRDLVRMHEALNQVLTEEGLANRRVIVIIDEAQNLDNSVLETVRLLSDFETKREKLMQIIISGQPELAKKLASPELEQLHQRLQVITRLTPLTQDEITAYVEHRLKKSGYAGGQLFTPEALRLIAKHSRGTPRKINTVCFNALLLAFARESNLIDAYMIDEVISDLELRGESVEQETVAPGSVRLAPSLPLSRPAAANAAAPQSARAAEARGGAATGVLPRPEPRPGPVHREAAMGHAGGGSNAGAGNGRGKDGKSGQKAAPAAPFAARPTPAPMASIASRKSRSRAGWVGPVVAGGVCVALLAAISFLYQRANSPAKTDVVAAHSTAPQAKTTTPAVTAAPAASASQTPQSPGITDLTVPPENNGASAPAQTAGQPASPQAEAPQAQVERPGNSSTQQQDTPETASSNAEPQNAAAQPRNRVGRATRRPGKSTPAQDNTPEVVTRNFGSPGTAAAGGAGSSEPAATANTAAAQPSTPANVAPSTPPPVAAVSGNSSSPAALNGSPAVASPTLASNETGDAAAGTVPENVNLPERAARARLIYKVAPQNPQGVTGGSAVVLQAVVGKDGSVRDLHLVSGSSRLGEAAMEAASRWQFQPYKVNGQAVEFTTQLHVDFAGQ